MAPPRQAGATIERSAAPDALVAAAKTSLAEHVPSAITGRGLAATAGVNYGQLHRHFDSKSDVLAVAFDELLAEFAATGTDADGVPRPLAFREHPSFWRAITLLMLDRSEFDELRPSSGVLRRAVQGVRARRPDLSVDQAVTVIVLGISIEFGVLIYADLFGAAVGVDPAAQEVDALVGEWLQGLYGGHGPLGAVPHRSSRPLLSERREFGGPADAGTDAGTAQRDAPGATERLVDAGAHLLERFAPSAITGRQLARAAGVNYGLIHHYFGTKDAVLRRSVQLHRDRFFAAYSDQHRAPGFFSMANHPGYVRAVTWGAIDPELRGGEERFPVIDLMLRRRLTGTVDDADALAVRVAVFVVVAAQMAWALFTDMFAVALDVDPDRLQGQAAPLLDQLLRRPGGAGGCMA
jgi:AcrR family transcriptional regulator